MSDENKKNFQKSITIFFSSNEKRRSSQKLFNNLTNN